MKRASGLRILVAAAFALSSLVVMAAPAAAETTLIACNGTCGYYEVADQGPTGQQGALCRYDTASFELTFISVRPPSMHGNYPYKTKVAWRFKIRHSSSTTGPWSTIFTSSYQSTKADDAIPAYARHGFSRRRWYPSAVPSGYYLVWVEMGWWRNGSMEGFARVEYDHYETLWNSTSGYYPGSCSGVIN